MEPEVRNKLDLAIEIRDVYAREILDFAGNPAIEVEVLAGGEIKGKASMAGKNYSKKEVEEVCNMLNISCSFKGSGYVNKQSINNGSNLNRTTKVEFELK